jgi:release factor glutamine methyltransferase
VSLRDLLRQNTIDRADSRVLLMHLTGFNHARLLAYDDYVLTEAQIENYNQLVQRVQNGEPLAYIVGYREFYSRQFKVTPDTLIPRPETEILVEQVLDKALSGAKVLDLGTGSACIALTLKLERPDLRVTAVDKFANTLAIAQQNAVNLQAEIEFVCSDWYSSLGRQQFDIIVSNPPYIEVNDEHLKALSYEPQRALTDFADGLNCIREITRLSHEHLLPNGWLLIEHGYNQGASVREIFTKNGLDYVTTILDYAGLERITMGKTLKY